MARHVRIRDVLDEVVPALRHLPVHIPRLGHEEVIVGAPRVERERLHAPARREQLRQALVVLRQAVGVPCAVVADDGVAAVDAELDAAGPTLPAVVAEHLLDVGGEGGGDVVPAAAVGAPGEEGAGGAEGDVEGAVGEGGLVLVHPVEEGGVGAAEVLVVLAVVPDEEPGAVVAVGDVVGLGRGGLVVLLVGYRALHAGEELVFFERGGFGLGPVGVGVREEPFELLRGVFGPSLIQGRGEEGGFVGAEGEEELVLRLGRWRDVLFAHGGGGGG